jgi:hypothetical protein
MISPLNWQEPIVDKDGRPTDFLMVLWEQLRSLTLSELLDVDISNPVNGQVLTYDASLKKWIPS